MLRPSKTILGVVGLIVASVGGLALTNDPYTIDVVLPAATNLVKGSEVEIDGATAGKVSDLEVRDGKAIVTVSLEDDYAPLKDGTTARVSYKALLGERILELMPGEESAADLESGALVEGTVDRVELDQVLAALDEPTRERLKSLVDRVATTLDGREPNVRETLRTLGPAAQALGQLLDAIGSDGPAIRNLVTRLATLTSTLAERDTQLGSTISDLSQAVGTISTNRDQLGRALEDLPETLDVAETTLGEVPGTVDQASPLLEALRPGMERLPGVASHLSPVLRDLRPTIAELRPTLASLSDLLGYTPALLDGAQTLLPQANQVLNDLGPAVTYLRPYTPELAGWLSNWGSAAANYDSNGHYLRAFGQEGSTSFVNNPGVMPPGTTRHLERVPGASEGQPWTDANGSEPQ